MGLTTKEWVKTSSDKIIHEVKPLRNEIKRRFESDEKCVNITHLDEVVDNLNTIEKDLKVIKIGFTVFEGPKLVVKL